MSTATHIAPPRGDTGPVVTVAAVFTSLCMALAVLVGPRQALLFVIGGGLGVALWHGAFGFTGGWRRMVVERRGRAIRAQALMIAVAALMMIPFLAAHQGGGYAGAIAPVGVSVVVGSALFGCGMQLGGGCGSGTLFTVGGGSARMLITLVFFCAGALWGAADLGFWQALPAFAPVDLGRSLGAFGATLLTFAALAAVAGASTLVEIRAHGALERPARPARVGAGRLLRGPWPLMAAGLVLAALNFATLAVAGHPWSITFGYGLWAAKLAQAVGVHVQDWPFFASGYAARALARPVLEDVTSVMNFGVMLGAALAAGLAGRFAPRAPIPPLSALAAAIGGLMMGYGARLSFGCNIGALFSGIASGSLHGWVWFACAFAGSMAGVRARRLFGLG
jgi:uncharacterized membrane protein YedE/YeeE